MSLDKINLWRTTRDYIFITLGMAIYALGFCAFILPQKVVIGGVAGLGTIAYFTLGVPVAYAACHSIPRSGQEVRIRHHIRSHNDICVGRYLPTSF